MQKDLLSKQLKCLNRLINQKLNHGTWRNFLIFKNFNYFKYFFNLRQPAIVTLGLSASKFVEFTKTTNPLLKYFNNSKKTDEINIEEHKEDNNKIENDIEPCTSSDLNESIENENNLSNLIETMNASDSNIEHLESKQSVEPSTSKSTHNKSNSDESHLDADSNFDNDDIIVVENDSKQSVPTNYFQPQIENLEASDYVQCEKCLKKVLCWFMPEHEDFHYAQELSKQLSSTERASNVLADESNNKKRSLTETPTKNQKDNDSDKNKKASKNKKLKTDTTTKTNSKPINNYFTKLNK